MSVAVITGSAGLIGSEAALHFAKMGMHVVGIDNGMRSYFFGSDGDTSRRLTYLQQELGGSYSHVDLDIRSAECVEKVFAEYSGSIGLVIHTAAQPSHDWAAREPLTDFGVNAVGTLNVLEASRAHAIDAPFIFTSTNKVYGDRPNSLPLVEHEARFEIEPDHRYAGGITEDMSIDTTLHSVFGASKVAADIMVQEYGRYFGMRTVCFRGGTLTGPGHSAAELHGFLAYLMRCTVEDRPYRVYGYGGKQVRDAIHSSDLISAFDAFARAPEVAKVYNIGGGRQSNCSVIEAIHLCEEIAGRSLDWSYVDEARRGDHIWWVGSNASFENDYPEWQLNYGIRSILEEIFHARS